MDKSCLKGRSVIESFFNIVMMASNGLQYDIEFIDEPMNTDYEQANDNSDSTPSLTFISALAIFYRNEGGYELKERLTFHIISKKNYDSVITKDSDYNNNNKKKINTLWIQFCSPGSTN